MTQNADGMYAPSVSEEDAIAKIGNAGYSSLQQAFDAARGIVSDEPVNITLLGSYTGPGAILPSGSNIILDFGGFTYTNNGGVGSTGTETNGFQLLRDSTVVFRNGTLTAVDSPACRILIQNYSNLTLENMTVNADGSTEYAVSNNFGSLTVKDGTTINASEGNYAFDLYYWPENGYGDGITVSIEGGVINGNVQYGTDNSDAAAGFRGKAILNITDGTFKGSISIYGKADGTTEESKPDINISGGTFISNVSDYLVDGFTLVQNDDGTYGVQEYTPVLTSEGVNLYVGGGDYQIELTGEYSGTITYTSEDEAIATVDAEGTVQAVAVGKTTVTVTVGDRSAILEVIVYENPLPDAENIVVDPFDESDADIIDVSDMPSGIPSDGLQTGMILDLSAAEGTTGPYTFTVGFEIFSKTITADNYTDYEFYVLHFTNGVVELADITVSSEGVSVTVDSFSPFQFSYVEKSVAPGPGGDDDTPVNPPIIDDDDEYVPLPPQIVVDDSDSSGSDSMAVVACAAAAAVAAIVAVLLIYVYRKD